MLPKTRVFVQLQSYVLNVNENNYFTLVAAVQDLGDGTYSLDFSTTPMNPEPSPNWKGRGMLTVYFQYTCGIGALYPPLKDNWETGASSRAVYNRTNITIPPYRHFRPPESNIDLSSYDLVVSFGDSLMELLVKNRNADFYRDRLAWHGNIWQAINNSTLERALKVLDQWHGQDLSKPNVALILGSAVWDMTADPTPQVGPNFDDHMQAIREFITRIRRKYPTVPLYWKSPSAFHVHLLPATCHTKKKCIELTRYMSASRSQRLCELQRELIIKELNVPWMELYEAYLLSADYSDDGRHFQAVFNRRVLGWFYRDDGNVISAS
jgi:hypothetical protein